MITQEQIDYIESEEFIEGFKCLELEVPWITKEAIYKLEEILTKDDIVLEIGVGGSTLFYANRCKLVFGIDTSLEYLEKVMGKLFEKEIFNAHCKDGISEDYICDNISKMEYSNLFTVFSVDTQGGINRSKILNSFIQKKHSNLRIIILDNYSHEGLFPDHFKGLDLGEEWEEFTYDHDRWAGSGTKILIRK